MERRHILQYRINSSRQDIHDLMGLKGPVAPLRSLCPEYVHLYQNRNGRIRSGERDIQPFYQCIDRNDRLTEQEFGKAPYCSVLCSERIRRVFSASIPLVLTSDTPRIYAWT